SDSGEVPSDSEGVPSDSGEVPSDSGKVSNQDAAAIAPSQKQLIITPEQGAYISMLTKRLQ
ncbi:MAG: hypothetical protein AAFO83_12910, partial [Cyanobacteria bacterium J06607_13]